MLKSIALILLIVCGVGVLIIVIWPSTPSVTPKVAYAGEITTTTNRSAGFYITNTGPCAILLQKVRLETQANSNWTTKQSFPIQLAPDDKRASMHTTPWLVLGSGEHAKILLSMPADEVWRASIDYSEQEAGIESLTKRVQILWKQHQWPSTVYGSPKQVASNEIRVGS